MTSTPTTRLRLEKQGTGENPNDWGNRANNVFDLLDEAVGGFASIAVDADVTLTVADYASDQARRAVLRFTGAGGKTITFPTTEKLYYIDNQCAADVLVKTPAGANATVLKNTKRIVYCDGTNMVTDTTVATSATAVAFDPTGNVAATTVQNAIAEVDTEKVAKSGDTMTGNLTTPGLLVDPWFYLTKDGNSDPVLGMDQMDYLTYPRAANVFRFVTANMTQLEIDAVSVRTGPSLFVSGRQVTAPTPFNSSATGVTVFTAETTLIETALGATGTCLFAVPAARVANSGAAVDLVYYIRLYDRTAGDALILTLGRSVSATASFGSTAVISFPVSATVTPGKTYLLRFNCQKVTEGGQVITAHDIRIDGVFW